MRKLAIVVMVATVMIASLGTPSRAADPLVAAGPGSDMLRDDSLFDAYLGSSRAPDARRRAREKP